MKQNFLKIPINRILALILLDIMSIVVASFAALYIRFDFSFEGIPQEYLVKFENIIVYNIILTLLFFALWKLYKSVWRYASATELLNIVFATTCASIAQMILCHILNQKMPRSYYVIYWFLLFGLTTVIRFSYRILRLINSKRSELKTKKDGSNVMLIGAGAAANAILKEIETSRYLNLNPKCIIDDNPGCHGKFLRGVPIVGGRDRIADAVGQYSVDEIIFAIPSANTHVKKEILDICKETGCKMRTLPGMYQLINGDVSVAKLKEVEIEDLLGLNDPPKMVHRSTNPLPANQRALLLCLTLAQKQSSFCLLQNRSPESQSPTFRRPADRGYNTLDFASKVRVPKRGVAPFGFPPSFPFLGYKTDLAGFTSEKRKSKKAPSPSSKGMLTVLLYIYPKVVFLQYCVSVGCGVVSLT